MPRQLPVTFMRLPAVQARFPITKSGLYALVRDGRFPPPVKLTERCSAWIDEEVDAVAAARAAALDHEATRDLVRDLVAARPHVDAHARRAAALSSRLQG
jgi:prophage regulatory protein